MKNLGKFAGLVVVATALMTSSFAEAGEKSIKIGVLTDLSSFGSSSMGPGSVVAAELAVKDFGGKVLGKPVEVISADMQSKPDLAVTLARHWFDIDGVDVIIDVPASAAAVTIQAMAVEKHKLFLATVAATTELTGKACSALGVHWVMDTGAIARGMVNALARDGAKSWYLLMPDYAVGKAIAASTQASVEAGGGRILDTIFFPPNSADYAQYLLQAQQSGADVIGDGAIGRDLVNMVKEATEFHILPSSKQKLAAFILNLSDIDSVGLETMQGVWLIQDFYWDDNDETRAFAKEFFAIRNKMPNYTHASDYSGVLAYLKAVEAAGSDDPTAVVAKLKAGPVNRFGQKLVLRQDGRLLNAVGLYQVKSPQESKYPWDYLKLVRQIPGEEAFLPLSAGGCPLVKAQ